jgi:hypothetical protein
MQITRTIMVGFGRSISYLCIFVKTIFEEKTAAKFLDLLVKFKVMCLENYRNADNLNSNGPIWTDLVFDLCRSYRLPLRRRQPRNSLTFKVNFKVILMEKYKNAQLESALFISTIAVPGNSYSATYATHCTVYDDILRVYRW